MGKSTLRIFVITALVVILEFMLTGCNAWGETTHQETRNGLNLPELTETDDRIWLEIDPTQGWNSPWREWMWAEWIGRNYADWTQTYQDYWIAEQDYPDCPVRCEQNRDLFPGQACMIECLVKHFYLLQEITVYNVEVSTYQEKFGHMIAICEAEDCPAGYTLYVQVAETDRDRMLELGFRNIVTSCETLPPDIYVYGCNP